MNLGVWAILIGAAVLEVVGDVVVRKGLYGSPIWLIGVGGLMLVAYSLLVNSVRWDFSKLLGSYVAVFALFSVLAGRYFFRESIPTTTWLGLGIMLVGAVVIQWGTK